MLRLPVLLFGCIATAACGDDVAATETGGTTGGTTASTGEQPTGGPPEVACAARTLETEIWASIGLCTDLTCSTVSGPWGTVPAEPVDGYNDQHEAQCVVDGTRAGPEGGQWWIFRDCVGDTITADQVLGLLWEPNQPLALELVAGQAVRVRHIRWGDGYGGFQDAWSLADANARPIAIYSRRNGVPDPWLTAPVELEMAEQPCSPTDMNCSGEYRPSNLTFRLGELATTVASGNAGVLGDDPLLDLFVFEAGIGRGYNCGYYSDFTNLSFTVVAH